MRSLQPIGHRRAVLGAVMLALAITLLPIGCTATGVLVPNDPGDDDQNPDGPGQSDHVGVGVPSVPEVPGDEPPGGPQIPTDPEGQREVPLGLETPPEKGDEGNLLTPDDPLFIIIVLIIIGVVGTYAPGEIRRMRIEAAQRESMAARLALARGEFAAALAAFDRAIEQTHTAYTKRTQPGSPAEWKLIPDDFYIGLWKGRAAALEGLGRKRTAAVTRLLAEELEATVRSAE